MNPRWPKEGDEVRLRESRSGRSGIVTMVSPRGDDWALVYVNWGGSFGTYAHDELEISG